MRILVACEESQAVTIAFREKGHEAYSCDLLESSGGHPEWHIKGDILYLLDHSDYFITQDYKIHGVEKWDIIIGFPTCTYLTNAGTRHFSRRINSEKKVLKREKLRRDAAVFKTA